MADGKPSAIRYLPSASSFDLHVLGTPPAFILSQDQTLREIGLTIWAQNSRFPSYHSSIVKVPLFLLIF